MSNRRAFLKNNSGESWEVSAQPPYLENSCSFWWIRSKPLAATASQTPHKPDNPSDIRDSGTNSVSGRTLPKSLPNCFSKRRADWTHTCALKPDSSFALPALPSTLLTISTCKNFRIFRIKDNNYKSTTSKIAKYKFHLAESTPASINLSKTLTQPNTTTHSTPSSIYFIYTVYPIFVLLILLR